MLLRQVMTVVAALAVLIFTLKAAQMVWDGSRTFETDLWAYFSGAERLRNGEPLYPPDLDIVESRLQYAYPPLLAQVLYPIRSYTLAWWLWLAGSLVCWAVSLWLLLRELLKTAAGQQLRHSGLWWVFLACLVNFPPLLAHLTWGQLQLPLLLLLTGAWLALRAGRDLRAGVLIGLAITLKVYPVLLLVPLLVQRRLRCVVVALAVSGALLGLSFAAVGWEQTLFYLVRVLPEVSKQDVLADNYAITQSLRVIGGPGFPAEILGLVLRAAGLGLATLAAYRARGQAERALALGVTALLWVTPIIWAHYFVLVYLPLADALPRASRRDQALLALAYFCIATATLIFYVPDPIAPLTQPIPVLGVALLLGVQCASLIRNT
ncbi:MAG: hypothetical protein OHK0022_14500 [Roseiflexaceae bacterium]